MPGAQPLENGKVRYIDVALAATATTAEIDLKGGTLVGITIPELTSTSFTITAAAATGGTFRTVRDSTGIYAAAGSDITFTISSTSVGFYPIPPALTAGLRFVKIVFGSSETATITAAIRSIE